MHLSPGLNPWDVSVRNTSEPHRHGFDIGLGEEAPATVLLVRVQGLERWEWWVDGKYRDWNAYNYRHRTGIIDGRAENGKWFGLGLTACTDEIRCPEFYTGPLPEGLHWQSLWMALPVQSVAACEIPFGPTPRHPYMMHGCLVRGNDRSESLDGLYASLSQRYPDGPLAGDRIVRRLVKP